MANRQKKIAIITGASSGMGMEFARKIDSRFGGIDEIWLIARREDRLKELASRLEKPCKIIVADLSKDEELFKITGLLIKNSPNVKMLVNSAGFGKFDKFEAISREDNLNMINVNCTALTDITYKVLPYMSVNGVIINFASSAAFLPQPKFTVYAASKSYVLSFSRALRQELQSRNIRVCAVCPGPVKTEFFDLAEEKHQVLWYKKFIMADCEKVVLVALNDALAGKSTSVYGLPIKAFNVIAKILPHSLLLKIVGGLNGR